MNAKMKFPDDATVSFALAIDMVGLDVTMLVSRISLSSVRAEIDYFSSQLEIRNRLETPLTLSPGGHVPVPGAHKKYRRPEPVQKLKYSHLPPWIPLRSRL